MPNALYWSVLGVVAVTGLAGRLYVGRPLFRRLATPLGRVDLVAALTSVVALGFHCAAMFFRSVVLAVPGTDAAVAAVNDLGAASHGAFWMPALLLTVAIRRAWVPMLIAETAALLAVGVTMFLSFDLSVHLIAVAIAVAVTVVLLTSVFPSTSRHSAGGVRQVGPMRRNAA